MIFLKKTHFWSAVVAAIAILVLQGCKTPEAQPEKSGGTPLASAQPVESDMTYAWQGFPPPCPTPKDAKILIEKFTPGVVKPGCEFTFKLDIANNAGYKIDTLSLQEKLPQDFKLIKSRPVGDMKDGSISWTFNNIAPGEKKRIDVTGKITRPGAGMYYGNTELTFEAGGDLTSVINVIEPVLEFNVSAPNVVVVNQNFPVKFMFRNTGQADVTGTKLVHTLPKGLLTSEGKSKIEMNVGDLLPGENRGFDLKLRSDTTGKFDVTFVATADEGVTAKGNMKLSSTKPELSITGSAPKKCYVGKIIPYTVSVKNTGDATATNAIVDLDLPEGVSLASANEGGQAKGNSVVWKFPSLAPGESKRMIARVVAKKIMMARAVATATTLGADPVEAVMFTDVAGIAAVLGSLGDINDPVPLGESEIYEITVMNQGSLPATKIRVKAVMQKGYMEFVKSSGATKSSVSDNVITFEPLPALAPQAEAKWRVIVKALKEGDVRFTIYIESDQLTRPVVISESTHFYE